LASVRVWQVVIGRKSIAAPMDNPMGRKELFATKQPAQNTTAGAARLLAYSILGVVLGVASGCSTPGVKHGEPSVNQTSFAAPTTPAPAPPVTVTNEPIRQQAATELGPEVAEAIPAATRPAPRPIDAGAKRLVDAMLASLPANATSNGAPVQVSLNSIRNQSRGSVAEFTAMLERFAGLLNDAADGTSIHFASVPGEVTAFEMQGAAYLATREGFDLWEMYLSLSPVQKPLTLWQQNGAVWLLRQPRPGQPQVLMER